MFTLLPIIEVLLLPLLLFNGNGNAGCWWWKGKRNSPHCTALGARVGSVPYSAAVHKIGGGGGGGTKHIHFEDCIDVCAAAKFTLFLSLSLSLSLIFSHSAF